MAVIIFVTGGILSDETRGFLKENSEPYINKPFKLQDVQEALKTVMNGPI
ncbi:MAG: hypothetical protein ABII68_09775 [Pseudomonadota bacterium]